MVDKSTSFSFPSFRRLRRYLGETDAMVELTELAARSLQASARASDNTFDYVSALSEQHSIRVNVPEVENLTSHLSRSYIVTVYHAAELFFREFRGEYVDLYQKEWPRVRSKIDPLTVILRNIAKNQAEAEDKIGRDLISRFQYYRIVRNWAIHSRGSDLRTPQKKYDSLVPYSCEHKQLFNSVTAPHSPQELVFDDFILFSRLTKLIAEKLCEISKPPDDHWATAIPLAPFRKFLNNPKRMRNAISGKIQTDYGMDVTNANWIAEEIYRSLA